jgi:hypothetical protein
MILALLVVDRRIAGVTLDRRAGRHRPHEGSLGSASVVRRKTGEEVENSGPAVRRGAPTGTIVAVLVNVRNRTRRC